MTEYSRPWSGVSYTDEQWRDIYERLFAQNDGNRGIVPDVDSELAVSGTSSPVTVAAGAALIKGLPYWSDAGTPVTIPTPASSTRIDRIVLRMDWTAEEAVITRIAGSEGGGAPAITQTGGSIWDIKLAQCSITTGGVITVTDERELLNAPGSIRYGNSTELTIASGAITIPVGGGYHSIDTEGDAASDDLDTINGGIQGDVCVLHAENAARVVTAKDGTGNILLPDGDYALNDLEKMLVLMHDGSYWRPLSGITAAHNAATAQVHGLPANVHVLGSGAGAGEYANYGTASAAVGTSYTASIRNHRDTTITVTWAVAYSATPIATISMRGNSDLALSAITTLSTTQVRGRFLAASEAGGWPSTVYMYAIGVGS